MEHNKVSEYLMHVAFGLEVVPAPSITDLKSNLLRVLVATDRSLSVTIRDVIVNKIVELMPGEFTDDRYDTNVRGKGFRPGYISFGLDPMTWDDSGIIGGILFKGTYDPNSFRSEAPDVQDEISNFNHSKGGGVFDIKLEAGYYNKRSEGSYQNNRFLSTITVMVDAKENIIDIEISNPSSLISSIKDLIQDVSSNTPDIAKSEKLKRKESGSKVTFQSFLKMLKDAGRKSIFRSEILKLSEMVAKRLDRAQGTIVGEAEKFYRDRGFSIIEEK